MLQHSSYNPELVTSDFHLFGPLMELMEDQKFEHYEQIQQDICHFMHRL
jgi:hypothetical protein